MPVPAGVPGERQAGSACRSRTSRCPTAASRSGRPARAAALLDAHVRQQRVPREVEDVACGPRRRCRRCARDRTDRGCDTRRQRALGPAQRVRREVLQAAGPSGGSASPAASCSSTRPRSRSRDRREAWNGRRAFTTLGSRLTRLTGIERSAFPTTPVLSAPVRHHVER